ncbi:hypothetical protein [Frigidibacter sp. ROC022]|uniref:hypothetical protein n=1 Tax=Frigidibacter sp. ROC022 TaxID=2971796 RepID=UPI00215B69BA|nr:hypothetical protein [Frigidibacter sp. ROC022]MCR8722998.1 hypothetical protein [Frigidibacter sp. ROC022]
MMRIWVVAAGIAVLGSLSMAGVAKAGVVERACLSSDRKGASRALCGCIQQVADLTLSRSDQRLAAKFFKDPQKAQDIRQSKSSSHNDFWGKYKNFGDTAAAFCSVSG